MAPSAASTSLPSMSMWGSNVMASTLQGPDRRRGYPCRGGPGDAVIVQCVRIGALDLGSNSFHLLVADVHPDGTFESIAREKDMLRLGDEVAREGRITDTTAGRVVESARHLKQLADASGATEVIAKATSAIRSAANGSDVVDAIEDATGINVEVINGQEEARLIFGAIRASVVIDPSPAL